MSVGGTLPLADWRVKAEAGAERAGGRRTPVMTLISVAPPGDRETEAVHSR